MRIENIWSGDTTDTIHKEEEMMWRKTETETERDELGLGVLPTTARESGCTHGYWIRG